VAVAINGGGLGVLDAAGGTSCAGSERPRCAVTPPDLVAQTPAWSQDSTRLVFAGAPVIHHPRPGQPYVFDLYEIKADGTGLRRLTRSRGASEYEPAWSPNARRVVFRAERRLGLWLLTPNGRRRITRADDTDPVFSPNGRVVYFLRHIPASDRDRRRVPAHDRRPGLYEIPVDGGAPRRVLAGRSGYADLTLAARWP
jgi:Tol biopolymer transport system component